MKNLNKNIKVFFIDLDGTMLDAKDEKGFHTISEENLNAIKEISKTKKVVISTGRIGSTVEKFMKMTNTTYAVSGNGSIVIDNKGKVYKEDKLTVRQVLMIVDFAKEHKLSFKVDAENLAYGSIGAKHRFFAKRFGFVPRDNYNVDVHVEYLKIVLWGKTKKSMERLVGKLGNRINGLSVVTSSNGWTMEVTEEKATKGFGNLKVASLLGIENKSEMLHIGDTMNDSTVIPHMRFVAMGNSSRKLKQMTNFIAPSYKKQGVAATLKGDYIDKSENAKPVKQKVIIEKAEPKKKPKKVAKKKASVKKEVKENKDEKNNITK